MGYLTIRDLENLSGIKAHTLRVWEQRYSFLRPARTGTNIRYYSNEELKVILNVALLNKHGYRISQIDKMNDAGLRQKVLELNSMEAVQDRVIYELIQAMVDLDMEQFETVLDSFIFNRGIDKAITQVIFPFLERVRTLWMADNITPAQENLVSNIIRQKIIVGIDSIISQEQAGKSVLLFLPEGEHHELGLLYAWYLMKLRGVKTLYLGADVPLKDIEFVIRLKKPDYIYTHLTSKPKYFNLEKFLDRVASQVRVVISGSRVVAQAKKSYETVDFKRSLQDVLGFVASL
ncbi:MAG TPA: MerR family transcriptional regulator [Chitinophagaceae bacterium]|nr:MerR family transcriptional regulator [Chitinophagaceae bacterium]